MKYWFVSMDTYYIHTLFITNDFVLPSVFGKNRKMRYVWKNFAFICCFRMTTFILCIVDASVSVCVWMCVCLMIDRFLNWIYIYRISYDVILFSSNRRAFFYASLFFWVLQQQQQIFENENMHRNIYHYILWWIMMIHVPIAYITIKRV